VQEAGMTAPTSQQARFTFAQRKHNIATTAALVITFWSIAAAAVAILHQRIDATSPVASVAVKVAAVVVVAAAYIRLTAARTTVDNALLVGTAWVVFGIAAEIAVTTTSGRQWFALLGSPANFILRSVLLIAWVIAPALFIRSHE
jgi:hypothetical protein